MEKQIEIQPHGKWTKCVIFAIILALLLMAMSCGVNRCIKVLERKGALDTVVVEKVDTLRIDVPVVTVHERLRRDTLVEYLQGETIIRYRYTTKTDSILVEADCPDNEVITNTRKETVYIQKSITWKDKLMWGAVGVGVVVLVWFLKERG